MYRNRILFVFCVIKMFCKNSLYPTCFIIVSPERNVYLKEKLHQYKTVLYSEDDHQRRNVSVASGPSDQPM